MAFAILLSLVVHGGPTKPVDFGPRRTAHPLAPATNRVVAEVDVGGQPYGLAAGGGSVWVGNNGSDSVARIDTATNRVVAEIPTGDRPLGLAYDDADRSVWVADFGDSL